MKKRKRIQKKTKDNLLYELRRKQDDNFVLRANFIYKKTAEK